MVKWEYQLVPMNTLMDNGTLMVMNDLGSRGWEFVQLEYGHMIFKRQINDES